MNRRHFCRTTATLAALAATRSALGAESTACRHVSAQVTAAPPVPVPNGQRVPFGWRSASITTREHPPLVLEWPQLQAGDAPTHFRLINALDERDDKRVEVSLARSGRPLGSMEVRFASLLQVHSLPLRGEDAPAVLREGVALHLSQGSPLEILMGGAQLPAAFSPHLLLPGTRGALDEYFARMNSLACLQAFGWMEGCVLDGLLDLSAVPRHAALKATAQEHLALFFSGERLVYENHLSAPSDGRLYGIEGTLPFAALARLQPQHPALQLAVDFWQTRRRPSGSIQDGGHMSTEGAYTIAYPMARIARARNDEAMMRDALYQCRLRQTRLFDGLELWRTYNDDGKRGNRNWARGIAWQILGLARTLAVAQARNDIGDLVIGLQRLATWSMKLQRADGLWGVFADDPAIGPDTGGSAGIAAALAIGVRHGWLGAEASDAAHRTLTALRAHLTPDGFLGGVTQGNKSSEELQRGTYRVIYPMAMGLMAQLLAALEPDRPSRP